MTGEWAQLYDQIWRILVEEKAKRSPRGADVRAAKRAADLVEKIRGTERAVVMERTLLGIGRSDFGRAAGGDSGFDRVQSAL
jgi:hypothetical protein